MKIIDQLKDDEFVIKVSGPEQLTRVGIAHDYVQLSGTTLLSTDHTKFGLGKCLKGPHTAACNAIWIPSSVQVPIRIAQEVLMPVLLQNKYLKPEHLATRENKGQPYEPYTYYDQILAYYDTDTKTPMVACIMQGETKVNHMTRAFYDKYVAKKDNV